MDNTHQQPQLQPHPQPQPQPQYPQQQQQQQQQQQHSGTTSPSMSQPPLITTPAWMVVIRGFQFFLAIIILGLSGAIIHYVYMGELGLSVAMSLFTWIIVLYAVLTEKLAGLRSLYHLYAVLALDLFLVILWLSTMGAVAAARASFIYTVNATCVSDGSAVNSGQCTVWKRSRSIVMGPGALAMLSSIAGLSALQLILFLVTFIWTLVQFLKWRKTNAPTAAAGVSQGEIPMESKQPFLTQSTVYPPQQQQQQQQPSQGQYYPSPGQTPQPQTPTQYQQQHPPQHAPQQYQEGPGQYQQPQYDQYQQQQLYPQGQSQPFNPSPVTPPPQGQGFTYPPQELRS